jgi:large subunit ribosomal protein L17
MRHRRLRGKLNVKPAHKRALVRNQVIHLITYGSLKTTKPQAREVQRLAEKDVTIARQGKDFNTIRRVKQMLPYKEDAIKSLFVDIAPRYKDRAGGYTRIVPLGTRLSDTAPIAKLMWVE